MNLPEALTRVKQYEPLLNQQFTDLKDGVVYTVRIITIVPSEMRNVPSYQLSEISNTAYLETLKGKDCIIVFAMNLSGSDVAFYEDNMEDSFKIHLEKFRNSHE